LAHATPVPSARAEARSAPNFDRLRRRDVLRGLIDQLLIVGRQQLVCVLRTYVEHYNRHRPHRSLAHATPVPSALVEPRSGPVLGGLRRRDLLGGLIHEYESAA
jgi:putative transposase